MKSVKGVWGSEERFIQIGDKRGIDAMNASAVVLVPHVVTQKRAKFGHGFSVLASELV